MRVPEYRQSLSVIKAPPGDEAEPFTHFLRLESPVFKPAPADMAIAFDPQPLANLGMVRGTGLAPFSSAVQARRLSPRPMAAKFVCRPALLFPSPVDHLQCRLCPRALCRSTSTTISRPIWYSPAPAACGCCARTVRAQFTDVTAQTKLPKAVTNARYTGAWAVDIEADGDLDIVLGANEGLPLVLRNNGDGTFTGDPSLCRNPGPAWICLGGS